MHSKKVNKNIKLIKIKVLLLALMLRTKAIPPPIFFQPHYGVGRVTGKKTDSSEVYPTKKKRRKQSKR